MTKILAVDDDKFVLSIIDRQLKALGYSNVTTLADPLKALELLASKPDGFDFLLLDLNMPEIDGIQFMRRLPEDFTGKIVIISGEDDDVRDWSSKFGVRRNLQIIGQLPKPPKKEDLEELLG